jgi:hypothetical protein
LFYLDFRRLALFAHCVGFVCAFWLGILDLGDRLAQLCHETSGARGMFPICSNTKQEVAQAKICGHFAPAQGGLAQRKRSWPAGYAG